MSFSGVHEVFEWRVGVCPDAVAVVEPDGVSLTYRQLNARANQLARELGRRGIGRGSLVGLRLRHSATEVVAILAVIKAGAAYVPLEPGLPEQRLIHMATDSGARLILTTTGHDWTHTDTPVLNLDQLDTGHHDDTNPNLPINPAPTTQEVLAQIWQEVLDVPQVKPDDNFFALGGHSLSAVRMLFKARERLAAELTMRDLHEIADLAALAELVERRRP